MSETNQTNASGSVDSSSGESHRESVEESNSVDYKSYKKLLTERKNDKQKMNDLTSELESFRSKERDENETKAAEAGQWDQLKNGYQERINSLETKLQTKVKQEQESVKLHAFLENVPGKISNNRYLDLIDIEEIAIDPETLEVDPISLESTVSKFVTQFPEVIRPMGNKAPPSYGKLGAVDYKKSLKDLSTEELKNRFINSNF